MDVAPAWEEARPNLRLRIHALDTIPRVESVVSWAIGPDVLAVLDYDRPTGLVNVTPEAAEVWGQGRDALWRAAVENAGRDPVPRVLEIPSGQTAMTAIEGESSATATNVLWLDRYLAVDRSRGALVGLPTRHFLLAHAIQDRAVFDAVRSMFQWLPRLYSQGPGSISPNLYWWRPGSLLVHLPVDREQQELLPPREFLLVLDALRPPR